MGLKHFLLVISLVCGLKAKAQTGGQNPMPASDSRTVHLPRLDSSTVGKDRSIYIIDCCFCSQAPFRGSNPWFLNRNFGSYVLTAEAIEAMSSFNLNDQLSLLPGFYQQRSGGELNVTGARPDGNLYILDGIQLR